MSNKEKCTAKLLSPTDISVLGPETLQDWRNEHRLPVPGAKYTPAYKRGRWDGYHSPGRWCRARGDGRWELRGSRGLVRRLAQTFEVTLHSNGDAFANTIEQRTLTWLANDAGSLVQEGVERLGLGGFRDYQWEALTRALTAQWGRVALATNAGKGAVIALLTAFARMQNLRAIVLCDEVAVFDALHEEITEWSGHPPGEVSSDVKHPPKEAVVLCMVPTLARRLGKKRRGECSKQEEEWRQWVGEQTVVLLDEADKATAATWKRILAYATQSYWRLGFSGSFPDPMYKPYEDLRLDELMGGVLVEAKNIDMVERGVSARPSIELYNFDVTSTLTAAFPSGPSFWKLSPPQKRQRVYETAINENPYRHDFVTALIRPDTPTAVVVNRIVHGERLAESIPGAVFLDGSITSKQREETLASFQRGEFRVLVVTKILDRGTNRLGTASDLIFASGEGSTRQTLQRIGRGLRRAGGKEFLRLVDIIDHVVIEPGSKWSLGKMARRYLHKAARKRARLYRDEGFDVEIVK